MASIFSFLLSALWALLLVDWSGVLFSACIYISRVAIWNRDQKPGGLDGVASVRVYVIRLRIMIMSICPMHVLPDYSVFLVTHSLGLLIFVVFVSHISLLSQ